MTEHYLNQITYSGNYAVIHCVTLRAHPSNQTLDKIQEHANCPNLFFWQTKQRLMANGLLAPVPFGSLNDADMQTDVHRRAKTKNIWAPANIALKLNLNCTSVGEKDK